LFVRHNMLGAARIRRQFMRDINRNVAVADKGVDMLHVRAKRAIRHAALRNGRAKFDHWFIMRDAERYVVVVRYHIG